MGYLTWDEAAMSGVVAEAMRNADFRVAAEAIAAVRDLDEPSEGVSDEDVVEAILRRMLEADAKLVGRALGKAIEESWKA